MNKDYLRTMIQIQEFKLGAEQVIIVTLPLSGFENAKNAAYGLNKLYKCASCTVWAEVILGEAIKTWSAQTPLCNSLVYSTHARKSAMELLSCGFRAYSTEHPVTCTFSTGAESQHINATQEQEELLLENNQI